MTITAGTETSTRKEVAGMKIHNTHKVDLWTRGKTTLRNIEQK